MKMKESTKEKNFRNFFLEFLLITLNFQSSKGESNSEDNKNILEYPETNELDIANNIIKKNSNNIISQSTEDEVNFIKKIMNEYNYNVHKFLNELNELLKTKTIFNGISIFDIFCFCLLCTKNYESLLEDININFKFISQWLIFLINLESIQNLWKNRNIQ